jgi:hypothetical protein
MLSTHRLSLLAVLAALAVPAAASATTYTVNPGEKIQDAVDKAAAGDTIVIKAGTYNESVSVTKAGLTFTGEPGAVVLSPSSATGSTPTFSFSATAGNPDAIGGLVIANEVTTGPAVAAPTVGLALTDSTVLGAKGDGVDFGGSAKDLVQRSSLISFAASGASTTIGTGGSAETLTIDSSVLVGKQALAAAYATPATAAAPGITIAARHVTAIGNTIADASAAQLPLGASPIAITYLDSIVRGKLTQTDSPGGVKGTIAADKARNSVADTAADAATLFANPAKFNFHLRADAPVIGKGQVTSGESTTDIDGQPRSTGSVSDYGADEFVDRVPKAAVSASAATVRQNAPLTFDASKSTDPDVGDSIASYRWDFGDGQTATTSTPTTTHSFADKGSVTVKVVVVDKEGQASDAASVPVTVIDGVPPVLKISSPFKNQKVTAYNRKHRRVSVQFFGTATDDTAMGRVVLALRPVTKSGGKCRWFDGKSKLVKADCAAPTVFAASLTGSRWIFSLPRRAKLPTGLYYLYAGPVDASGLAGPVTIVKFRLR